MKPLTFVAAFAAVALSADFKQPCVESWDICGWALQADYGYSSDVLSRATSDANQDASKGTIVFDSIYNCFENGIVEWSAWCGGAGECNPSPNSESHAMCLGEPVDTGSPPPVWDGGDDGGDGGDGGYDGGDGDGGGDDGGDNGGWDDGGDDGGDGDFGDLVPDEPIHP